MLVSPIGILLGCSGKMWCETRVKADCSLLESTMFLVFSKPFYLGKFILLLDTSKTNLFFSAPPNWLFSPIEPNRSFGCRMGTNSTGYWSPIPGQINRKKIVTSAKFLNPVSLVHGRGPVAVPVGPHLAPHLPQCFHGSPATSSSSSSCGKWIPFLFKSHWSGRCFHRCLAPVTIQRKQSPWEKTYTKGFSFYNGVYNFPSLVTVRKVL